MSQLDRIAVSVLALKPHPCQATTNPGCWAVQLCVTHAGTARTFWRWFSVRERNSNGGYVTPSNTTRPTAEEIIAEFWDDTFRNLHGFDFDSLEAAA